MGVCSFLLKCCLFCLSAVFFSFFGLLFVTFSRTSYLWNYRVLTETFVGLKCPASPVAFREEAAVRVMSVKRVGGRHQAWIGVVTRVM